MHSMSSSPRLHRWHSSRLRRTGWRGEMRDDCRSWLQDFDGQSIERWLAAGVARVVKRGANRIVYRVELAGQAFFVKHFVASSWRDLLRWSLRGSPARREWGKTLEVLRRGLPTAEPVAWLERRRGLRGRESYFVTHAIESAPTLASALANWPSLSAAQSLRLRRQLIDRLAELCAACHAAGVQQTDLHAGNLLVQWPRWVVRRDASSPTDSASTDQQERNDSVRLYLIDLPTVRLRSASLDWAATRANLATLRAAMRDDCTPRDRWRFWRSYLASRSDLASASPREAAQEIERCAWGVVRHVVSGRDRRCGRNNRDFQCRQLPQGRLHGTMDLPPAELAAIGDDPGRLLQAFRHHTVKLSHTSVVVQARLSTTAGPINVAYKRSRPKRWWKAWLAWLRPPRALTNWRLGHALLLRGIATARPLVCFQPRGGGDGYLATEWVAGAENLHLYGWRIAELPSDERFVRARRCLERLGQLIGRMHNWDVSHRDLKAGNLAVVEGSDQTAAYLIDLDGARLARRLSRRLRIGNLGRMAVSLRLHPWVSRTLVLRFLLAYLRERGLSAEAWKPLWRESAAASHRILRARDRRGRLVA